MWDWLKHRRRSRRENRTVAANNTPVPGTSIDSTLGTRTNPLTGLYRLTGDGSYPFFVLSTSVEPKCLRTLPCSQILYGARVENFSSGCWLENNLHMFGSPSQTSDNVHNSDNRNSGVASQVDDCFDFLDDEFDTETLASDENDEENSNVSDTDDHFLPFEDTGTELDMSFDLHNLVNPPPYSEFEPPPTYEEAVGSVDRRSNSSRSTSSSLAFMW